MAKKKTDFYKRFNYKNALIIKKVSIVVLAVLFIFLLWLWLQNPAKRAEKPLAAALSGLHPSLICDNGVGRFGVDSSPWYTAYLNIDDGTNGQSLTPIVLSVVQKYGYKLQVDTKRINSIANGGSDSLPGEKLDTNGLNQYYAGSNGADDLSIAIIRVGSEPTVCVGYVPPGHANYPMHSPQPGRAMLELGLSPR
ncbi:MAG: hypothetical protein ACREGG_04175 [Candidatus Saccharimonadales bacterium]